MRAFDYGRWEFWASANDWGYGPWLTEAGWSNGWITTVLALRGANTTLWDILMRAPLDAKETRRICLEMLAPLHSTDLCGGDPPAALIAVVP